MYVRVWIQILGDHQCSAEHDAKDEIIGTLISSFASCSAEERYNNNNNNNNKRNNNNNNSNNNNNNNNINNNKGQGEEDRVLFGR